MKKPIFVNPTGTPVLHPSRKRNPPRLAIALVLISLVWQSACLPQANPPGSARPTAGPAGSADALSGASQAARTYLDAWGQGELSQMYDQLTQLSQDAISLADFSTAYQDAAKEMTLTRVDTEILGGLMTGQSSAQVSYRATYHTSLFGDLQSQMVMNLSAEGGAWKVQWQASLIHDQLSGDDRRLKTEITVPARGNIYDRAGHALAAFSDAVALGVVPGELDPTQENDLLATLSDLTGKTPEQIQGLYQDANPEWYIPVGEVSSEAVQEHYDALNSYAGLKMNTFRARFYYDGSVAAQVVGYLQPIPAGDELDYAQKGYLADEKVGASGLEAWGEPWLRGRPKASLYVVNDQDQIITRLAAIDSQPAQSIYTTLDKDLENKIQLSMGNQRGAVVVLERDTGRVLAMVSNPTFDANIFEPTNLNSNQLQTVLNDAETPLLNRATQGVYPLGSVFKTITMAAALESGRFSVDTTYPCGYVFSDLGFPLYDWTYAYGVASSGILNLPGGLIRSCDPWFWHIGLDLYQQPDHQHDIENMARAFGLGQLTGIEQVAESAGSVPTAEKDYNAVELAIGQDELQVTPLQVAEFMAAIGNGGSLYRPQLVEKIAPLDGDPSYTFKPELNGSLPVSPEHLKAIQDALYGVIHSTEPRGTAYFVLANLPVDASGKTGTAETATDPHAWFAGYTSANQPDKPDIAVAIILENAGEGSEMAAPIFRRIVTLYFSDNQDPGVVLPWESSYYQLATPQPTPTGTPTPLSSATPQP